MDVTINDLIEAQKGSTSAQEKLMQNLYQPVYHFMVKRTGRTEVADELSQTVFLKCYERIAHYTVSKGTVYTWVFTIARNTLIDYFRKAKDEVLAEPEQLQNDDRHLETDHQAKERLDNAFLAQLLEQLPAEEADVVTLRAIDEMPYAMIARIIGKNQSATRKVYSRGVARLRTLVAAE